MCACSKSVLGGLKLTFDTRVILCARAALAWMKKDMEMRNLKQTDLQRLKNR